MSKKFYLTTPLHNVNEVPHLGHVYTAVIADAVARHKRMAGFDVCLLTGTGEHGLSVERAARRQGLDPERAVDLYADAFKRVWGKLGLRFDVFTRTTQRRHALTVEEIYRRIQKNRFIYLGEYSGYYCVHCEANAPEDQKVCPGCLRPAEFMTEESYLFKLSAFQEKLLGFYQDNPSFVIPTTRMNEIVSFVKGGLNDLSISRTSFSWGIPVPENPKHIFYVWFDALQGYLSGVGLAEDEATFERYWPADVQLIGKDILRFHAVYWPAFLMAAGLEPPRRILAHGLWAVDGKLMSRSRGNFIAGQELVDLLEPDHLKYFLLREIALGSDGDFSYERLVNRVNGDLANALGNLSNRTLKMIESYFEGKIPEPGEVEGRDLELAQFTKETTQLYRENFERLQIDRALDNVWELVAVAGKYIAANEPWNLAKDTGHRERLGTVLYHAAEALRIIAVLLSPIIPAGASALLRQLGVTAKDDLHPVAAVNWGHLKAGTPMGRVEAIYPRIDVRSFLDRVQEYRRSRAVEVDPSIQAEPFTQENLISIKDFSRVEMKVGKILVAEPISGSDKLLRLEVDIGTEVRQVVAAIATEYPPESLPGRLVVVVTNLKPSTLKGVESSGMIVAASERGKPVLATFTEPVKIGARLK